MKFRSIGRAVITHQKTPERITVPKCRIPTTPPPASQPYAPTEGQAPPPISIFKSCPSCESCQNWPSPWPPSRLRGFARDSHPPPHALTEGHGQHPLSRHSPQEAAKTIPNHPAQSAPGHPSTRQRCGVRNEVPLDRTSRHHPPKNPRADHCAQVSHSDHPTARQPAIRTHRRPARHQPQSILKSCSSCKSCPKPFCPALASRRVRPFRLHPSPTISASPYALTEGHASETPDCPPPTTQCQLTSTSRYIQHPAWTPFAVSRLRARSCVFFRGRYFPEVPMRCRAPPGMKWARARGARWAACGSRRRMGDADRLWGPTGTQQKMRREGQRAGSTARRLA